MARRMRLDAELVRRGLARSRVHAGDLIASGRVAVSGAVASKTATVVSTDAPIVVRADYSRPDYVSRGGHKLAGALAAFAPQGLDVGDRRCLDAGASTGGFTDVLLRAGAREVIAVDVGYGQLAWSLRTDQRVRVLDRVNVRELTLAHVGEPVEVVVADLSFISLTAVLPALAGVASGSADFAVMVKPQFEVGRDNIGRGVVRDPQLRAQAVVSVATAARGTGLGVRMLAASPLPGPAGNVEYFLWLRRDAPDVDPAQVARVVAHGPTGEKVGR